MKDSALPCRCWIVQYFAVGFSLQSGGLVEGIGDGNEMMAFVETVVGVFARAVLEAREVVTVFGPVTIGALMILD
ncbi:MAG: hypothetical protein JWQ69_623 [Pseudomonas sp.]|nr:hypothetical protein [Pseudomonas sp.]